MSNVFSIAQWYTQPHWINESHQDYLREEILDKISKCKEFGRKDDSIIVRVSDGRVLIEKNIVNGCPLRFFAFLKNDSWARSDFWMNESSVKELIEHIINCKEKEVKFDSIFGDAI